jgi:hypothetical protein
LRRHGVAVHVGEPLLLMGGSARTSTAPRVMKTGGGHGGQRELDMSRLLEDHGPVRATCLSISRMLALQGISAG